VWGSAAVARQAAERAASAGPSGQPRNEPYFRYRLERDWERAYQQALAPAVAGKLTRRQRTVVARCAMFCFSRYGRRLAGLPEDLDPALLLPLSEAEWEQRCLGIVREAWSRGPFPLSVLRVLADLLGIDAARQFRPSRELLEVCGDDDLRAIARACAIDAAGGRPALLAAISAAAWPPEELPRCLREPRQPGRRR
jgi:hypothetical protein